MRPASDELTAAIGTSAELVASVEVWNDAGPIASTGYDSNGGALDLLPLYVESLSLTWDRARAILTDGSARFTVYGSGVDVDGLIGGINGTLSPFSGHRVRVSAGYAPIVNGEQSPQVIDLATLVVDEVEATEDADGVTVDLTLLDLSSRLDVAFVDVTTIAAGTTVEEAITSILWGVLPGWPILTTASGRTTPLLTYDARANRLDAVLQIAAGAGLDFTFDALGVALLRPVSTTDGAPVVTWGPDEVVVRARSKVALSDSYNGAIVELANHTADDGVNSTAEAWDTDPTSPLYYDPLYPGASKVGPRPLFIQNETTDGDYTTALIVARTELAKLKGIQQRAALDVPFDPRVEPGDLATIEQAGVGVANTYSVERVTMDLTEATMTVDTCRRATTL